MATDQEIKDAGYKFISQQKYLQNPFTIPTTTEEEETVTENFGIPYTGAFTQSGGGGGGSGAYTGREYNPESYVTNRGFLSGDYVQGTEPEETKLQKFGHMMGQGIMNFVPGMRFIAGLDKFNTLSPADQEFARQQMSFDEQSVHGGNMSGQDRYGYNKRSLMGNYANVISKRVDIANARLAEGKELRDIDQYYLDKEEEQNTLINQMKINDRKRLRYSADKIRASQAKDIDVFNYNIHGDGEGATTTGGTWTPTPGKDYSDKELSEIGRQHYTGPGMAFEAKTSVSGIGPKKDGGRVGYRGGQLVRPGPGRPGYKGRNMLGDIDPQNTTGWKESGAHISSGEFFSGGGGNGSTVTSDGINVVPVVETRFNRLTGGEDPVAGGLTSNTKLGRVKAMIDARKLHDALTYGKEDDTVVNSLSDVASLIDPTVSWDKQFDKGNLGYKTNLKDSHVLSGSYTPTENITLGATTDLNNINLGAAINKGPLSVGVNYDPTTGDKYIGGKLSWIWGGQDGGLVGIL